MPAFSDDTSDTFAESLSAVPAGSPVSGVKGRMFEQFTGGGLEPGTRLPPERQLASALGVGRSVVCGELAVFEILGILDVRRGSGASLRGGASELLPPVLQLGLMISGRPTPPW